MLEKLLIVTIEHCGEVVLFVFETLQALNLAQVQPSSILVYVKRPLKSVISLNIQPISISFHSLWSYHELTVYRVPQWIGRLGTSSCNSPDDHSTAWCHLQAL